MDLFKSQFDRIQKQLSALTPSQKMLTAAMVAIMVMTLVWWGRYAGEPEMEPLLPQSISAEDLANVETQLDAKGIKHAMAGDKILVPADRKVEAVASLMYAHALPHNAQDGFDEVLKNINPFMSQTQTDKMWNRGKEMTCAQIISHFPEVSEANVMIDPTREVRIGGGVEPSATVTITTRSGEKFPKRLVDAAAYVVRGAQSSLLQKNIRIVINGMPCRVQNTDEAGGMDGGEQLEKTQQAETFLVANVEKVVCIPNAMVSVTVTINASHLVEHSKKFDKDGVIQKEAQIDVKTSETVGPASGGAEVGATPNTGLSIAQGPAAAAAGPTSNTEDTKTTMQISVPETITDKTTPAGSFKATGACVRVPLSYFAAIYTHDNPTVKDPTEAQMSKMIDGQLKKIREAVQTTCSLTPETVSVDTYLDPAPLANAPVTASAGMSVALLAGGHIRDAIVGVLALVSLFMVSMVVKKGTPVPLAMPAAAPVGPAPVIEVGGDLAGEVGTGNTTLDGMEMDEDAVRSQQMLEQVANLVKENPDSAASLVKRWLNRA